MRISAGITLTRRSEYAATLMAERELEGGGAPLSSVATAKRATAEKRTPIMKMAELPKRARAGAAGGDGGGVGAASARGGVTPAAAGAAAHAAISAGTGDERSSMWSAACSSPAALASVRSPTSAAILANAGARWGSAVRNPSSPGKPAASAAA